VEVTRDLAEKVNRLYGKIFVVPQASILQEVATVPGLDGQKMSKSYNNTVGLFEEERALRKRIMGIVTESTPVESPKDPSKSVIVDFYRLFASQADVETMEQEFRTGGIGYGEFKKRLFGAIWEYFAPMRARRAELEAEPDSVDRILKDGAERARAVAENTMKRVREGLGLR
jgi:tryptophanyl-tRNA synthetase